MEKNGITQHAFEGGSDYTEPPVNAPRPGKGAALKRHLRRFWWLHLIIFVVVTLVIALPL